jgi:uncharacterized protein (DUF433 family)
VANVDDLLEQINRLEPGERERLAARVLQIASASWPWPPGIEKTPGVCGGEARIVRTRIPVWVLEQMRRLNMSEAEILRSYPTLRAEDLVHAWAYVDLHRSEIDELIRANEEA